MLKRPIHWLLYGGFWLFMGLYYFSWDLLAYQKFAWILLPMNLCQTGVWGLEGILVIKAAERFPIESFGRKSLGAWIINLGLGVFLAVLGLVVAWFIALAFQGKHEGNMSAWQALLKFAFTYLHSTLLLLWGILGAFHAFRFYQGMQAREVEKAQLEASLTLARNQTLLAQFQPHFLFNALNSISELIHDDPEGADRMVARLGDLLRMNLDAGASQEITLEGELALVEAYLAIEKVRFQERLTVETDVPPELRKARVPKFLLQPLVENALKHGLSPRSRQGLLRIRASREGRWLQLEVQDNGAGFEGAREGVGLANTRARLAMLHHEDQSLEIYAVPDKGTRVVIRIPHR